MLKQKKTCIHPVLGEISVEISPRRSRVAVAIGLENDVPGIVLKLPAIPHCEPEKYFPFIDSHIAWIQKKFSELQKKTVIHTYEPGDVFYYLGKPYPLVQDTTAFFSGTEFHTAVHSPALVKRELEKIYMRLAADYIVPLCRETAAKFNLTIGQIRINKAEKRWGSCNLKGDLNFSYHLITHSEEFILYTICHELAHRIHMNHSRAFYAVLKRFYPAPVPKK